MFDISGSTIKFPFQSDVRGTLKTTSARNEIVVQAIQDVLETRRGERVMLLDYGIADFIFAVQDFSFAPRLAFHLEEQIKKYVPLVESITATADTDENGQAVLHLSYTIVGEINAPKNLVFPVWQYVEKV